MTAEQTRDLPSTDLEVMPSIRPYDEWQQREGPPRVTGYYVEDLASVDVSPWSSRGALGAFVNLEGTGGVNDLQIMELPAGSASAPIRHLFEALAYVVTGRGSATVSLSIFPGRARCGGATVTTSGRPISCRMCVHSSCTPGKRGARADGTC
jgi:hypothetical protein